MKKILIVLALITFYSKLSFSQVPDIVKRTIYFKLNQSDFDDSDVLFMTIDTSLNKKDIMDFDHIRYDDYVSFYNDYMKMVTFFKNKRAIQFYNLDNNNLYLSSKHLAVVMKDIESKNLYRIEWWFSEKTNDNPKLKGLSFVLDN